MSDKAETTQKEITVQGIAVTISAPYVAGMTISEAEAKALNQVRAENIGNNTRRFIKELLEEEGATPDSVQGQAQARVSEIDEGYEFTLASVGGGSNKLDPLTKEARTIARNFIAGRLKEMGKTQKEYLAENGEDAIKSKVIELADNPEVMKLAKKSLADKAKIAEMSL